MSERNELNEPIMLRASELGHRLWRNNSGVAKYKGDDGKTRHVAYGVASPGGSDLLGFTCKVITADMVGQTVAVFTACEDKTGTLPLTEDQGKFLKMVAAKGGIAIVARSVEDYEKIVR
jgi:hypothetical protein